MLRDNSKSYNFQRENLTVLSNKFKAVISITTLLFITNTAIANTPETWQTEQPCGEHLADFQATMLEGCIHAYCSTLSDHTQLCACQKEEVSDDMEVERIAANGQKNPYSKPRYRLVSAKNHFRYIVSILQVMEKNSFC